MSSFQFRRVAAMAAVLCAVLAVSPTLSAAPIGTISFGIVPTGGATGSATLIDWYPPVGGTWGNASTGGGSVTYNGGTITGGTNPYARIADLPAIALGSLPFTNFIQFYVSSSLPPADGSGAVMTFPMWSITAVGAPAAVDCSTNPGPNIPCSIYGVPLGPGTYDSPLVLTQDNFGGTDVRLSLVLLGEDSSGSIVWTGLATANVPGVTPFTIDQQITSGQTVNVQSWSLAITSIPEPSSITMALLGFAMVGFGVIRRKR